MKAIFLEMINTLESGLPLDKQLFKDDFSYAGASKMIDADVWLDFIASIRNPVEIVDYVYDDNKLVVFFLEFDEITLLKYRLCWFLTSDENSFTKLIEIKESVEC